MRLLSKSRAFCLGLVVGVSAGAWETNDWQFLDTMEQANLRFFQEQKRGPFSLLNDTAYYDQTGNYPAYSSVAGIGFELTAVCLGHYRGWISSSNAYEQVLKQLKLFKGQLSSDPLVGERVNGWTWHTYWIDDIGTNRAGRRFYMDDGLSLLDHSLFIGGCIFASEYFKGTEAGELARQLYAETTWSWRPNGDYNFGYSENLLAVVESAEAPNYKKGLEARTMWNSYMVPWPRTLQLYFWQYPHSWIDFRFRTDERGFNHADVARDSILYQRQRAAELNAADPAKYEMLGSNCWGWTAAGASDGYHQMAPWGLWLDTWYDEERASDSGSITPIGLPGCMIYAGAETMACMKNIFEQYYINGWNPSVGERPVWSSVYGWLNCLNKGRPWKYYADSGVSNHFHGINAAIDYGPNVLLLENYKLGSTWRWFMQNTSISSGMYTIGFGPPQNVTRSTFSNSVNQFGGGLGHWENDGTPVAISYEDADFTNADVGDKVVRIVADHANEGGWIDLNNCDQRAKAQMSFWMKGSSPTLRLDIGLKDQFAVENKVALTDFTGGVTPTNWTQVIIPVERFCLTGSVTNETWLGSLSLVSFAFAGSGGGTVDVDALAFTADTVPPVQPTNDFGLAMAGQTARLFWNPSGAERDVVGYHVWRRLDATSGFTRVTTTLVPAYRGSYEDTNFSVVAGQEVRYAIQALDNAEPQHAGPFAMEKTVRGGLFNLDWNNGKNPNTLGGTADTYWGGATTQLFEFVFTNGPFGASEWVRRSYVTSPASGHIIDCADSDLSDYWGLSFWIRGTRGGERVWVGLKDSGDRERKLDLDLFLANGAVTTTWTRVILPFGDFTNVNVSLLRHIAIAHEASNDIQLADIAFLPGQRAFLKADLWTEAENATRQYGAGATDYKTNASAGAMLGNGWGLYGGHYADYEFFLSRALTTPTLFLRYACNAGDGRAFEVRWDDAAIGSVVCTNTGGWGDGSNDFSWTSLTMPSLASGPHKLTWVANGYDEPVNLDAWYLAGAGELFRECEDVDRQAGSEGPDAKAGASGGAVLGNLWGYPAGSEAIYSNVAAGAQTGAWFHLWYARYADTGIVIDVELDSRRRARLYGPPTAGWGERAGQFDRASAGIGALDDGLHTLRLSVPAGGRAVNLDCFYLGPQGPEGSGLDSDGDGLNDREEGTAGTSAFATDTDGDGLDDGQEVQYGRGGQVSDPTLRDTDGDEQDDAGEAIAGTNPWDALSVFELTAMSTSAGALRLQWPAVSGRQYRLFYTGPFSNNAIFEAVGGGIIIEENLARYDDPATNRVRTYRIDVRK